MPNINDKVVKVKNLKKKILKDSENLLQVYGDLSKEINSRFREEFREKGSMSGLEDFYMLNNIMKKNLNSVKNICALMKRMQNIGDYEISEIEEKIEENMVKEILQ